MAYIELDPAVTYFDPATFFRCGAFFVAAFRDRLAGAKYLGVLEEEAVFNEAP